MAFEVCKFGRGVYRTCGFCGKWEGDLYCGLAKGKLEDARIEVLKKCPLTDPNRYKNKKPRGK